MLRRAWAWAQVDLGLNPSLLLIDFVIGPFLYLLHGQSEIYLKSLGAIYM